MPLQYNSNQRVLQRMYIKVLNATAIRFNHDYF